MSNRSELRLLRLLLDGLAYPELGYRQHLTRLKIAAADAAGSPYFHAGWSRRAAGTTTWKKKGSTPPARFFFQVGWRVAMDQLTGLSVLEQSILLRFSATFAVG